MNSLLFTHYLLSLLFLLYGIFTGSIAMIIIGSVWFALIILITVERERK